MAVSWGHASAIATECRGLVYHMIKRENGGQKVFLHERDYLAFLNAVAELKERKPFDRFGYCLMANHVHLLLRPGPGQSVSRIMQSLALAEKTHCALILA